MIQAKRNKLREPYRLLLLHDETLAEVGSYRLSLLNIYIAVSAILLLTSALVFSLIFLTPVRKLVPGYANVYESREYRELNRKVQDLESEMQDQRLYIARFRSLLAGIPVSDSLAEPFQSAASSGSSPEAYAVNPATLTSHTPLVSRDLQNIESSIPEIHGTSFLHVVPPIRGTISARYDPNSSHFGTDILAPENTPVVAILDGTVIASDWTLETGNTLGIQHAGNMVSFYKHNSHNLKHLGARVKAGEAIAIIGNTGETTSGPHLHFELWVDGKPLNPERFINF
jgi:murein DD-endopeptidase MepM/ murein hydrolase activator NlpD